MTAIRITREQAEAVIRAAAKDDTIHFLNLAPHGGLNRDSFDLATALITLDHAELFAYQEGPFGHDLAVLSYGRLYLFDVPFPTQDPQSSSSAEKLLEEHGDTLIRVLVQSESMLDRHPADIAWERDALLALRAYMEDYE